MDKEPEGSVAIHIADALERGRRAWPGIDLSPEVYERFLSRRVSSLHGELEPKPHADLFLACAVLAGVAGAREALEFSAMRDVPKAVSRVSSSPDFVADVSADLRVALLAEHDGKAALLEHYEGRGPLRSFVMVLAMRRALDRKRREREVPTEPNVLADLGAGNASFEIDSGEFQELFLAVLKENLSSLPPRDRNVLRMHVVDGVSADAIGRMYGVHRATATRWIASAKRTVFEQTRDSLQRKLSVSPATFESLARNAASRMDATLSSFLDDSSS